MNPSNAEPFGLTLLEAGRSLPSREEGRGRGKVPVSVCVYACNCFPEFPSTAFHRSSPPASFTVHFLFFLLLLPRLFHHLSSCIQTSSTLPHFLTSSSMASKRGRGLGAARGGQPPGGPRPHHRALPAPGRRKQSCMGRTGGDSLGNFGGPCALLACGLQNPVREIRTWPSEQRAAILRLCWHSAWRRCSHVQTSRNVDLHVEVAVNLKLEACCLDAQAKLALYEVRFAVALTWQHKAWCRNLHFGHHSAQAGLGRRAKERRGSGLRFNALKLKSKAPQQEGF